MLENVSLKLVGLQRGTCLPESGSCNALSLTMTLFQVCLAVDHINIFCD